MATKTKPMTAARAYSEVQRSAERIKSGEPATIEVMSPGDVQRQGDIMLVRLDGPLPEIGAWPHGNQLAQGDSQGSRHLAVGKGLRVYTPGPDSALTTLHRLVPATRRHRQLIGPAISTPDHPVTIPHPEHGHRTLPPGDYLVTYQRTGASAEEVRRVAD